MDQNQRHQSMAKYLDQLIADKTMTSTEKRTCLETIVTIYRNIVNKASDEKYRQIRTSNAKFESKVWKHFTARNVLLKNGWTLGFDSQNYDRQVIRFGDNTNEQIIQFLKLFIDSKLILKPDDQNSFNSNEQLDQIREQINYQESRRRAAEQRLRDLEAFKQNRIESQTIAENIRKEMKSDFKYKQMIKKISSN